MIPTRRDTRSLNNSLVESTCARAPKRTCDVVVAMKRDPSKSGLHLRGHISDRCTWGASVTTRGIHASSVCVPFYIQISAKWQLLLPMFYHSSVSYLGSNPFGC